MRHDRFNKHIHKIAKKNGLLLKQCSEYHFQLIGENLVNIYPTKNKYYVAGEKHSKKFDDVNLLAKIAIGNKPIHEPSNHIQEIVPTGERSHYKCAYCDFIDNSGIKVSQHAIIKHPGKSYYIAHEIFKPTHDIKEP